MPPPPLSPAGQPLADFGTRLLAYLIDSLLVSAISMVIFLPVLVIFFVTQMPDLSSVDPTYGPEPGFFLDFFVPLLVIELVYVVLLLAGYYVYYVEMLVRRSGQTLGKKVMKIRVSPIDPQASLTRGMAAKRYLVEVIGSSLIPFFVYLDGLWQLWDKPYQQTLHDKYAQTVVIKVSA